MKKEIRKSLSILLSFVVLLSSTGMAFANDAAGEATYSNIDILKEVAFAFNRQDGQIVYDQYHARRNVYASPEDATAQRTVFTDCSSFVNSCYREAFGVNVMPYEIGEPGTSPSTANMDKYAKENPDAIDVIGYWETKDYTTAEDEAKLMDEISSLLESGDVIVFRRISNAGHAVMYIGNKEIIHCGGAGSYYLDKGPEVAHDDYEKEVTWNNTIHVYHWDELFMPTSPYPSRYLLKKGSSQVSSISVLRPFARNLTPTEESLCRMKIAGLSMEKTSSVHENTAVNTGDTITYTIALENTNAHALSSVVISDVIPAGTDFVSGDEGVKVEGSSLSKSVDIGANETVYVNYTVKVTENTAGALIKSNATYAGGVKLGNITHVVSGYTKTQHALIGDTFIKFAKEGRTFENGLEMAKAAYKETFGIEITDAKTVSEALDLLIDAEGRTKRTDTAFSKMIAPNMYGGLDIKYGQLYLPEEEDRSRLPKKEHLAAGDIILAEHPDSTVVFMYAGGTTLVEYRDGKANLREIGKNIYTPMENALISLLAYNKQAVVRPSISSAPVALDAVSIEITTMPVKTNYDCYEFFENAGMVVKATMNDGTTRVIDNYTYQTAPLTAAQSSVTISFGNLSAEVPVTVSENKKYMSVSEVSLLPLRTPVTVEGIVIGPGMEGLKNDYELLIKDVNSDTVIAVRDIPYGAFPDYGYAIGDRIAICATVIQDTSATTGYTFKKCLEFSPHNGDIESTIISRNNEIRYDLKDVIEVNSWEDMKKYFVKAEIKPYTYFKFAPGLYITEHTDEYGGFVSALSYRLHKNDAATKKAEVYTDGSMSVVLNDIAMTQILGENWKNLISAGKATGYPGATVNKGFIALYFGGEKSFFQILILDEAHITNDTFYVEKADGNTADVNLPQEGEYTVIFAHYEEGALQNVNAVKKIITAENTGESKVSSELTLSKGDYVFIWDNNASCIRAQYKVK